MANWLNTHVGEIVLAASSIIVASVITGTFELGKLNSSVEAMDKRLVALEGELGTLKTSIEGLRGDMNVRFDELNAKLDVDDADLKNILVATGTVSPSDVFYAAMKQDSVWVFPSVELATTFTMKGLRQEPFNWFVDGFRVMPSSAIQP